MLPPAAATIPVWLVPQVPRKLLTNLSIVYGSALLCFLAGVRRGLSFRTAGGPTPIQIATMLWLFILGGTALALMLAQARAYSLALLLIGFTSVMMLDTTATSRGEVPPFFGRLRLGQMPIALAAYGALLAHEL